MQKYIIILANYEGETDYNNPMELMGADKNDIKKAISDNVPPELIRHIFTGQEYNEFIKKNGKAGRIIADVDYPEDISGTDFFNKAMTEAKQQAQASSLISDDAVSGYKEFNAQLKPDSVQTDDFAYAKPVQISNTVVSHSPVNETFFTDNGIIYKLAGGKLYKKVWQTILPDDEDYSEYRVISNKTGKIASSETYSVQKLVFVPIETN